MAGTRSAGEWATFRALANYIFGGNASQEKIAMTAPVLETRSGETWTMRFTMPQGRALGDLPAPTNAKVAIAVVPPTRVGVIAFSGYASDQDIESKAADLTKCLKANGFSPDGALALAQYDPLGAWPLASQRSDDPGQVGWKSQRLIQCLSNVFATLRRMRATPIATISATMGIATPMDIAGSTFNPAAPSASAPLPTKETM